MHKIKLNTKIKTVEGENMTETFTRNGKPVTEDITTGVALRAVLTKSLENDSRQDKETDFSMIFKILQAKDEISFSPEEITRLKHKIYAMYDAWIAGYLVCILENKKLPI